MKKFIIFLLFISSFYFFGCEFILDSIKDNQSTNDYYDDEEDEDLEQIEIDVNFTVQAFNKDSVVLQWSTDLSNVRYNIYVKDNLGVFDCIEENYGKKNYFVNSDDKSSYAIGILLDEEEIFVTDFVYPELENEKGFPVYGEISDDGYIGVEFLYPSNVESFYVKGEKENNKTFHTNKYTAEEMGSYLFPIRYEENSHNNWISVVFIINEVEYVSSPYYFDYDAHLEAKENGSVTFYPSL